MPASAARLPPPRPHRPVLLGICLGVLAGHIALLGSDLWRPPRWEWHNGAPGLPRPPAITVLASRAPSPAAPATPPASPAPSPAEPPAPAAPAETAPPSPRPQPAQTSTTARPEPPQNTTASASASPPPEPSTEPRIDTSASPDTASAADSTASPATRTDSSALTAQPDSAAAAPPEALATGERLGRINEVALTPESVERSAAIAADPDYEGRRAPQRVQLPGAVHLLYRAQQGTQTGEAEFEWQPEGGGYQTRLRVQMSGRPEVEWRSQGSLGAEGLAPLRMVERRRGKDTLAVNFQRDKELISFSGPTGVMPLIGGSQDRASWLPQLVGAVQARAAVLRPGAAVAFQVATPRGELLLWRFTLQGRVALSMGTRSVETLHWLREPVRPYDSRVEVWLDPLQQHLPLQLRLQVIPGRDPLLLQLQRGLP